MRHAATISHLKPLVCGVVLVLVLVLVGNMDEDGGIQSTQLSTTPCCPTHCTCGEIPQHTTHVSYAIQDSDISQSDTDVLLILCLHGGGQTSSSFHPLFTSLLPSPTSSPPSSTLPSSTPTPFPPQPSFPSSSFPHPSLQGQHGEDEDRAKIVLLAPDAIGHGATPLPSSFPDLAKGLDPQVQIGAAVEATLAFGVQHGLTVPRSSPLEGECGGLYSSLGLDPDRVKTVVVGHSMGGATAVWLASSPWAVDALNVVGLCVLDVVEGTALAASETMGGIVDAMPTSFASPQDAIQWYLATGLLRNPDSAALTVPPQLVETDDGDYVWRVDLKETAPVWDEWYAGLSAAFVAAPVRKLLMLAGTDRLDTPLMVAQMQGAFQLKILPSVGHWLHEDDPPGVAKHLRAFALFFGFL